MNRTIQGIVLFAVSISCHLYAQAQNSSRMLVVNHNAIFNYATFYSIGAGGSLTSSTTVGTGGFGTSQGNIGGVAVFHSASFPGKSEDCSFIADGASNAISAIDKDLNDIADFHGGALDFGSNGLSLAVNNGFLYAGFGGNSPTGGNSRLASFRIEPGCNLEYLGSVPAVGLGSGIPNFLAAHGNILVVSFDDGSIESFHFTNGVAQSNNDLQNTTGAAQQLIATAVDISQDGHFAVFGDFDKGKGQPVVEVADISTGKLTPTVVYRLSTDFLLSQYVRFSPDESLLYISGGEGDDPPLKSLGAAFFNKTTGAVTPGCFAPPLNDPNPQAWGFTANVAFANNAKGTGSPLYIMEVSVEFIGANQSLATVNVQSNGTSCSFKEAVGSPLTLESGSLDYGTIASWPPRAF